MSLCLKNPNSPYLLLVVALSCEAKAIRQWGEWKRHHKALKGCQLYERLDKPMLLILSGSGKIASAMATIWLGEQCQQMIKAFINIGVGGKAYANIGDCYWINKIIEASTGKNWFPQSVAKHKLKMGSLITFEQVQSEYPAEELIDMEASGFMQAATKWVSIENIVVIKCISDTNINHGEHLRPDDIYHLLLSQQEHLETSLDAIYASLIKYAQPTNASIDLEPWLTRWHFTFTQQHQLKEHLHALNYLNRIISPNDYSEVGCSKELLNRLKDLHLQASGLLYHE